MTCPVCKGEVPQERLRFRGTTYCSTRCTNRAARQRFRGAPIDTPPGRVGAPPGRPFPKLEDLTGETFGRLFVVAMVRRIPGSAIWLGRCLDCKGEANYRGSQLKGRESPCLACACRAKAKEHPAAKAPNAREGYCSWCPNAARGPFSHECRSCERMVCRNGRDESGRPIAIGPRGLLGEWRPKALRAARPAPGGPPCPWSGRPCDCSVRCALVADLTLTNTTKETSCSKST